MRLVSIETGLDEFKAHLGACGYEVIDMANCIRPVEAVIFSGSADVTAEWIGPADNTVLVNAFGKTPEEVAGLLGERLG